MFKRSKYNYAFRLRCVEAVVKGNHSILQVATENGITKSNLKLWVSFYEKYGKSGLKPRLAQQYDPVFKQQVLDTIEREFLSLRLACVRFNIPSESTIINWRRSFELNGSVGLISQRKGRPPKMKKPINKPKKSIKPLTREEELLKENEYLRAENALLKKLQALVQADKKQKPSSS